MAKTQKTISSTVVKQKVTHPPVSVIVTVLNEERTILQLLEALVSQTLLPSEAVIADGGSSDRTVKLMHRFVEEHPQLNLTVITAPGNRSVGRNAAIAATTSELIAVTDAGCIPEPSWVAKLVAAAQRAEKDVGKKEFVISGYYTARPKSAFEEAVVPYVLVMPDKVNPNKFLPATRSMLVTKQVWEKLGGFDEKLSDNEDYAFARKIEQANIPIFFTPLAIVEWLPRTSLKQFYWMIYRFARGDIYAGILRPKVLLVFARYIALLILLYLSWIDHQLPLFTLFAILAFLSYARWSVQKNRRYAPRGHRWLPVLQITADIAVMLGSIEGASRRIFSR